MLARQHGKVCPTISVHLRAFVHRCIVDVDTGAFPVLAEANVLASLSHPSIVKMQDSFLDGHYLYIVMELADGGDIGDYLEKRGRHGIAEPQALALFTELCMAMMYVHKKKILHRDLKAANVFLTSDLRYVRG